MLFDNPHKHNHTQEQRYRQQRLRHIPIFQNEMPQKSRRSYWKYNVDPYQFFGIDPSKFQMLTKIYSILKERRAYDKMYGTNLNSISQAQTNYERVRKFEEQIAQNEREAKLREEEIEQERQRLIWEEQERQRLIWEEKERQRLIWEEQERQRLRKEEERRREERRREERKREGHFFRWPFFGGQKTSYVDIPSGYASSVKQFSPTFQEELRLRLNLQNGRKSKIVASFPKISFEDLIKKVENAFSEQLRDIKVVGLLFRQYSLQAEDISKLHDMDTLEVKVEKVQSFK